MGAFRVGGLNQNGQRVVDATQAERKLSPRIPVVGGEPHVAVTLSGVEMAGRGRVGDERVGHVIERLGQPAASKVFHNLAEFNKLLI